jgi:hypothetical protein
MMNDWRIVRERLTFSMEARIDLLLVSLALSCNLPIPSCLSNTDFLVTGGRSDLLSTKLELDL